MEPTDVSNNREDPSGTVHVKGLTTITDSGRLYQTLIEEDHEMEVVHLDQYSLQSSKKRKVLSGLFLNINVFAVVVCLYIMSFVMVEMYIVAVITTIEKRFGFRSSSSGMLLSIKEIAYVCLVALSSHFGNRWNRPRFLSLMAVLGAFGSALSSLPHFLYDSPFHVILNSTDLTDDSKTRLLCQAEALGVPLAADGNTTYVNIEDCGMKESHQVAHNDRAYAIFAASNVVVGLAIAPMIACTTTYVDDAVGPVKNALYLAFMNMMRPLGPVLAFLAGALFTSFHESMEDPGYGPSDPRWVGAWWVGYLTGPCLLLIAAILIALFPRTMPKTWKREEEAIEMTIKTKIEEKGKENVITDLFRGVGRLLCNPIYMALMASGCFSSFVVSGMFPFMPKYIEVQFHLSASKANVLIGIVGSLLAGVGVLLGGVLSSRFKLRPSQSACFILMTDIIFIVAVLLMMSVTCPSVTYVGANNQFNETCSSTCGCEMNQFDPVCGSDGLTYTSPCTAGCKHYHNETLGDCSCVGAAGTAVPGSCDSGCQMWMLYMAALAGGAMIGMMASVPATTICLRCVEERDRSLALGFTGTVISLISFVPGPLLYGLLIDSACVLWADSCSNTGYCRVYNNDQFRFRLHGITAVLKGVAGLFYLLVWILIRKEEKKLSFTKVMLKEVPPPVEKFSDESSESAL